MDEQQTNGRKSRGGKMAQLNAAARSGIATADPFEGATETDGEEIVYERTIPPGDTSGPEEIPSLESLGIIKVEAPTPATSDEAEASASTSMETPSDEGETRRRKRAARGEASVGKGKTPALSAEDGQRIIALLEQLEERIEEVDPAMADERALTAVAEPAGPTVIQTIPVDPVIKAVERIGQTIGDRGRELTEWTKAQTEHEEELARAYNMMTSEWYKIAEQVPSVGRKLADLQGTIGRRQAEMEGTARTVKRVAVTAVVVIALAAVLTVALLLGIVYLAARSHRLL